MFINRTDHVESINRYWNNFSPSNIGIGRFTRNKETLLISKTGGRSDLVLINHYDGNQYCLEPSGAGWTRFPEEVKVEILKSIAGNFELYLRNLHYLNWLSSTEITNMIVPDVIELLQEGLDSFNYVDAMKLIPRCLID